MADLNTDMLFLLDVQMYSSLSDYRGDLGSKPTAALSVLHVSPAGQGLSFYGEEDWGPASVTGERGLPYYILGGGTVEISVVSPRFFDIAESLSLWECQLLSQAKVERVGSSPSPLFGYQ